MMNIIRILWNIKRILYTLQNIWDIFREKNKKSLFRIKTSLHMIYFNFNNFFENIINIHETKLNCLL